MAPKLAIVYYSMYGHIKQLAKAEAEGIKKAGGTVDFYQVEETLPKEVLQKMYAPTEQTEHPILSDPSVLEEYDGVLFGIPTRFGNMPAQLKAFWDKTGKQWQTGSFHGKYAGVFIGTAGIGGGQESTALAMMSTFAHHGFIYVPLGYKNAFAQLGGLDEVRGGTPWGAGTFSSGDGSRQPTALELEVATIQGEWFYKTVAKTTAWLHGGAAGAKTVAAVPTVGSPAGVATNTAGGNVATTNGTGAAAGAGTISHTYPTTSTQQTPAKSSVPQPTAQPHVRASEKESGPCGLPFKCSIQ